MTDSVFIAHVRKSDGAEQLLRDHLIQSAELARGYGESVGLGSVTYLAGLLHDTGKFSDEFQEYLRKSVKNPGSTVRGSVDHSTAGGQFIFEYTHQMGMPVYKQILGELVGNSIISHHSGNGLQDFLDGEGTANSTFLKRVADKELPEYETIKARFFREVITVDAFKKVIEQAELELADLNKGHRMTTEDTFFLLKTVYSCLLDADRTNTRCFEENTDVEKCDEQPLFFEYQKKMETHVENLNKQSTQNTINELRRKMSDICKAYGKQPTGIYSLSIPTGGGKTLASLRFALEHALTHKKKRIIYVVPFTTIIEQNAETVRKILQDETHILEHHSNIIEESSKKDPNNEEDIVEDEDAERQQVLMKDNWDAPIIFTTMVQFLNTIYSRGTRNPRRFHNLQDAVIIFDEVQSVPVKCTNLFVASLNYLKYFGHTTSILCTATQPALEKLEKGLAKDGEMIQQLTEIQQAFKRVEIHNKVEKVDWTEEETINLCKQIIQEKQSLLVILNTKSAVLKVFHELEKQNLLGVQLYHLSTAMCPNHRRAILSDIITKLKEKNPGEKIICVTTQLIEAGVDISFDSVIRSVAGLDSIAQAAGRCNRHGETKRQPVYLISLSNTLENLENLEEIKIGKAESLVMLKEMQVDRTLYDGDILSAKAQSLYFERFYRAIETELDYPVKNMNLKLYKLIGENKTVVDDYRNTLGETEKLVFKSSPKTVAKYFEVIDSPTKTVLVPYGEGSELIGQLNGELQMEEVIPLVKKAQAYSVNLFTHEIKALDASDAIYPLYNGEIFALNENAYSKEFGVDLTALAASEGIFF